MSAFGFLSSDIQNEFPETYLRVAEETRAQDLRETIEGLIAQADEWLEGEGVKEQKKQFDLYADCRYYLQNIQIPCRFELLSARAVRGGPSPALQLRPAGLSA
jgi:N-methylhydantoinase A